MIHSRYVSKWLSLLLLLSFVFGILSSVPSLEKTGYLLKLAYPSNQVYFASLFQIFMAIAYLGIVSLVYPILKKFNSSYALAFLGFRLVSVTLLFVSVIGLLYLGKLSSIYVTSPSILPGIETIAELIRLGRDWINHILVILTWIIGGVFMYVYFYKTKMLPQWISLGGILGSCSTILVTIALLFNQVQIVSIAYFLMNLPLAITEIFLAIYLYKWGLACET